MYDQILAKSFSRNEQKRFGNCIYFICIFVAFTFCTFLRPNFHLSLLLPVNVDMSTSSSINDTVIVSTSQVEQKIGIAKDREMILESLGKPHLSALAYVNQTKSKIPDSGPLIKTVNIIPPASGNRNYSSEDSREAGHSVDCIFSEALSDYCKIKGMVRIRGHSSTIFTTSNLAANKSWIIKPYPRKGSGAMKSVREWTIKQLIDDQGMPSCTTTHADPAILFSTGGFSGNHFHDFSDIIIPLFTNSRALNKKVHLLVTNYKPWWFSKFQRLLSQLSNHQIVDIDHSENQVHCFQNAIIGLASHQELGIDSSRSVNGYSMKDFRDFLRSAYSLKRRQVTKPKRGRARLMLISRKSTRRLTNEASIVKMAKNIGYEVIMGNVTLASNLSSFAQIVNSCDVFMGVHGAGLTNMVFLPDHAVVVQVVPLGGLQGIAKTYFGEPSKEMNLRYLSYIIRVKESSLSKQYSANDVVLKDPTVIHKQGWDALRTTYLVQQNVKLDVRRFRSTLLKALKLLH